VSVTDDKKVGNYSADEDVPLPGGADVRDPYPGFAAMRDGCPVLRVPSDATNGVPTSHDVYMAFCHDDVVSVLRDDKTFSPETSGVAMRDVMGRTILEMSGEEHMRYRALVAQAFRPKVLARWEDELVKPLVDELIDGFQPGRAELVREFLIHYPIRVIGRILGCPASDYSEFQKWAISIIAYAADKPRGLAGSRALQDYLTPILAARRAQPEDDVVSELVRAELDGHTLSDEEIMPFLLLLLPAGGETTYRATGNLLFGLLSNPDQLAAVRADRSLVPRAIEEALRWEPPLLILARTPTRDVEVHGTEMKKGDWITLGLGSSNRDTAFTPDDPDRFDIFRPQQQHVSFGTGPHMCLGMHLARMEMRIALNALLDRLPGLRLDPEAMAEEDPPHIHGMTFRSPTRLPVVWDR
jgi:cytochrome P450